MSEPAMETARHPNLLMSTLATGPAVATEEKITFNMFKARSRLTDDAVHATDDGPDPRRFRLARAERVQQLDVDDTEREDDSIEADVAEECGDEHHPRPALVRYERPTAAAWRALVCCARHVILTPHDNHENSPLFLSSLEQVLSVDFRAVLLYKEKNLGLWIEL